MLRSTPFVGLLLGVVLGVLPTTARGQYVDSILRETWTGVSGLATREGKPVLIPKQVWELVEFQDGRYGTLVPPPVRGRDRLKFPPRKQDPTEWKVGEQVLLRVRGDAVEFLGRPHESRLVPGDFDGLWLSAGSQPGEVPLSLVKEPAPESFWVVRGGQSQIWRKDHGRGGFQFELTFEIRWKLESALHPGWYLGRKKQSLILVSDPEQAVVVEFFQEHFFDDLSDGK